MTTAEMSPWGQKTKTIENPKLEDFSSAYRLNNGDEPLPKGWRWLDEYWMINRGKLKTQQGQGSFDEQIVNVPNQDPGWCDEDGWRYAYDFIKNEKRWSNAPLSSLSLTASLGCRTSLYFSLLN